MAGPARQAGTGQANIGRAVGLVALGGLAFGILLFVAGYVWFALSLARNEPRLTVRAEGIVVFTGGSDRVQEAAELLARGQANRMLITGVNRATRSSVLARLLPVSHRLFDCCVDLGYQAQDTIGNARETREWAQTRNISHSLIVVTSNYHMPRALAELSAELPDVTLHPFPVVSDHVNVAGWASDVGVIRLVGGEYLKYLGALARITLRQNETGPDMTALRGEPASP
ncbi:YdcF family protein [Methylocystis sp. Sn-Cys]|uniref:YdcF family protein n=1 Tax=Methylocystis sp. Sn-Cys TaxID=1701263 RepID=UPI00351CA3CC